MRAIVHRRRPPLSALTAAFAAVGLVLTGCTIGTEVESSAASTPAASTPAAATSASSTQAVAEQQSPEAPTTRPAPTPTAEQPLIGKTIYIDPGHGGPVGEEMWEQVPDGRGGTTACQSEGAATKGGLTEQTFNWQTSQLLSADLKRLGAVVITSRDDDAGSGGCVDQRIAAANQADADVFVSLHADAGPEFGYGFFVNYPSAATGEPFEEQSAELALALRDAMIAVDLTPSTYAGDEGLLARGDLAELGLAQAPAVVVHLANMNNGIEGALLADPAVRKGYSMALTTGIIDFLTGSVAPAD